MRGRGCAAGRGELYRPQLHTRAAEEDEGSAARGRWVHTRHTIRMLHACVKLKEKFLRRNAATRAMQLYPRLPSHARHVVSRQVAQPELTACAAQSQVRWVVHGYFG